MYPSARQISLLLGLVSLLFESVSSFTLIPSLHPSVRSTPTRSPLLRLAKEEEDENPTPSEEEETTLEASIPSPPRVQPTRSRRMDPLLASLTRTDPTAVSDTSKSIEAPLLGEITLDKSLFVILPTALFAVSGLLLSVYVGINSADQIVDSIVEITDGINAAAIAKTNVVPEGDGCRGLCSSQAEDLDSLRVFMQSLAGSK